MKGSAEFKRLTQLTLYEDIARKNGFVRIAGVDEAGRGPLAGPVVAAACVIPYEYLIDGVDDSKKLSVSERYALFQKIITAPEIDYGIGIISSEIIDQINILQATFQAMLAAITRLSQTPDFLLIDGNQLPPTTIPGKAIVKGDGLSQSIAAASILAKVTRDELMSAYHNEWPEYDFITHKGYATQSHLLAINKHGPCPIHRKSFEPIKSILTKQSMFSF